MGRKVIPFGLHQGADYLLAVLLIGTATHVGGRMQLALFCAAGALVAAAAVSDGPLGALSALGPRSHRAVDVAAAAGLAVSPFLARSDLDVLGVLVAEATALILARLVISTRYSPSAVAASGGPVTTARSRPSPPVGREPGDHPASDDGPVRRPRGTARTLGVLAGRARRAGGGRPVEERARQLGRVTGWVAQRHRG